MYISVSDPNLISPLLRQPLYRQVKDSIARILQTKQEGEKLGTEAEFAKGYGVSVWTVRQALTELELEGLVERRQGVGTFVPMATVPRSHVAVLINVDITEPHLSPSYLKSVKAACDALQDIGLPHRVYLGNAKLGDLSVGIASPQLLDDLSLGRIKGLIGFLLPRDTSWMEPFKQKKVSIVDTTLFDRGEEDLLHIAYAKECLAYFKERGRKRVAIIAWEHSGDGRRPYTKAFARWAPEYGISMDPRQVDYTASGWEEGMGWERFREEWLALPEKPDGLIVGDDMLFADAQKAIQELKIAVPETLDVAVLGSSDAVELNPQIPVRIWKVQVKEFAKIYAARMKALLDGLPVPELKKVPYIAESYEGTGKSLHKVASKADADLSSINL